MDVPELKLQIRITRHTLPEPMAQFKKLSEFWHDTTDSIVDDPYFTQNFAFQSNIKNQIDTGLNKLIKIEKEYLAYVSDQKEEARLAMEKREMRKAAHREMAT